MSNGTVTMTPELIHQLIAEGFKMRERAYAPYSNFHVGAALLCEDGTIVGGCNVENASYGAGICAERTAIPKAISMGHRRFLACVVTSRVPSPSVSPCGICRQVLREFLPLSAPIIMLSSTYPHDSPTPPPALFNVMSSKGLWKGQGQSLVKDTVQGTTTLDESLIKIMTLEELLPMSFGPEHLSMTQ